MLIFAKDISQRDHKHSGEEKDPELKQYMQYQRNLFPYTIIRAGLDLAYKELDDILLYIDNDHQPPSDSSRQDYPANPTDWYNSRFPWTSAFMKMEDMHFALVSLIQAMDSFRSQEEINSYHLMVLYDCTDNIIKVYNELLTTSPERARDIHLSSQNAAVNFDDFINNYWPSLDFTILSKPDYPHACHQGRNKRIEEAIQKNIGEGIDPVTALGKIGKSLGLDEITLALLRRDPVETKHLDLESLLLKENRFDRLYRETREHPTLGPIPLIDAEYSSSFEAAKSTNWTQV